MFVALPISARLCEFGSGHFLRFCPSTIFWKTYRVCAIYDPVAIPASPSITAVLPIFNDSTLMHPAVCNHMIDQIFTPGRMWPTNRHAVKRVHEAGVHTELGITCYPIVCYSGSKDHIEPNPPISHPKELQEYSRTVLPTCIYSDTKRDIDQICTRTEDECKEYRPLTVL